MEEKKTPTIIESLKIDVLKNKWVARLLFLVILLIRSMTKLYPVGDPDFSKVEKWYTQYRELGPGRATALGIPPFTTGNFIFRGFEILLFFVFIFIGLLYLAIYLSDKAEMSTGAGLLRYMKRLPTLMLFVFALTSIFAVPLLTVPPVALLILAPLALAPTLIIKDRMTAINASLASIKRTVGIKLPIFLTFLIHGLFFFSLRFVFALFMNPSIKPFYFIEGFWVAFYVLSFARLVGIVYDISDAREKASENNEQRH
jgi:hypothetical protein